ncbi:MAG: 50S ribosomal protein L23 [Cyanobacteria bacterium REEB65]|nr:50S ribosomal protein L23 [Cyanobacteria bacterium REEB65]
MNELYSVIKRPLITEKNTVLGEHNTYCFEVLRHANKIEIRQAVEALFEGVKVKSINTTAVKGHKKRISRKSPRLGHTADTKKAFVTLSEGTIDFYGGSQG